jgi:hypothetical protein
MTKPSKRETAAEAQQSVAFDYHENLTSIVRDLKSIAGLIPAETSRCGCLFDCKTCGEEMAIIEARKDDLLTYIRTICEDHIIWSNKLLEKGWIAKEKRGVKSRSGLRNGK